MSVTRQDPPSNRVEELLRDHRELVEYLGVSQQPIATRQSGERICQDPTCSCCQLLRDKLNPDDHRLVHGHDSRSGRTCRVCQKGRQSVEDSLSYSNGVVTKAPVEMLTRSTYYLETDSRPI